MNNSKFFITGGTGSFGKKFVSMTLKNIKIVILQSIPEMKTSNGIWSKVIKIKI